MDTKIVNVKDKAFSQYVDEENFSKNYYEFVFKIN